MKKMWWLSMLLALPMASAAGPLEFIGNVWNKILMIGGLSFLQGFGLVGFTRILIWILTFALFFAVMSFFGAEGAAERKTFAFLKRNQAMIIAAVLATISAIFLPATAILAVGAGWATAVGLILIGTPILGLGYVLWRIPGKDESGKSKETKGTVLLKLLISMLLFWILSAMNYSLVNERKITGDLFGSASVAGTMANFIAWALYIASIMIVYYIIKFFFTSSEGAEEAEKRWQEGGKDLGKWFGKKSEESKAKEEMQRRAQEVKEPKSYLIDAIEDCEKLTKIMFVRSPEDKKAAAPKAEKLLNSLKKDLKKASRSLRHLRRKERGAERTKFYEIFNKLQTNARVVLDRAKHISIPKASANDAEWQNAYAVVHGNTGIIKGVCGKVVEVLNVFMEQNLEAAHEEAERAVTYQAQMLAEEREKLRQVAQQQAQEQAQRAPTKLEQRALMRQGKKIQGKRGR